MVFDLGDEWDVVVERGRLVFGCVEVEVCDGGLQYELHQWDALCH